MIASAVPSFVQDLIRACPQAGSGVNNWLFRCARYLHALYSPDEIMSILTSGSSKCGRPVTIDEIDRAIENSRVCAWNPKHQAGKLAVAPKWPKPNIEQIEAIVRDGPGLVDLWELSPHRFEDNEQHTEEIVDQLFPGNPLLCAGWSSREFATRSREQWRGELAVMPFVVPSPMSAPTGLTKEGRMSAHSLANTGPRRFLVVECDFSIHARDGETETSFAPMIRRLANTGVNTLDMGAAILSDLGSRAPLALAVHSGGKSLHGWFSCHSQPEDTLRRFMRYAVSIGADAATWTRSQFVRVPDGKRENGNRQTIYFFNPSVIR